jgi:MraZ protein
MDFFGQYDCTMDEKGRIKMPATLRKQFGPEDGNKFMIAKDLEDCLVIYPMQTWNELAARLKKLDRIKSSHQKFISAITVGLTEVEMDNADRFLVSKSLTKYLGAGKDIVMKGVFDRIQVWEANKYDQYTQSNISNVEPLADEIAAYLDTKENKQS